MKFKALVCTAALLAGCTTTLPADQAVIDPYIPVVPEVQQPPRAVTGSIFYGSKTVAACLATNVSLRWAMW